MPQALSLAIIAQQIPIYIFSNYRFFRGFRSLPIPSILHKEIEHIFRNALVFDPHCTDTIHTGPKKPCLLFLCSPYNLAQS